MWHRDSYTPNEPFVEEHFILNTSSLVPGKPKVNPEFDLHSERENFRFYGMKRSDLRIIKEITIYFRLPANVAKQDTGYFVSAPFLQVSTIATSGWDILFFGFQSFTRTECWIRTSGRRLRLILKRSTRIPTMSSRWGSMQPKRNTTVLSVMFLWRSREIFKVL